MKDALAECKNELQSQLEPPKLTAEISFTEFKKREMDTLDPKYDPWNLYWRKYYSDAHLAYYLRKLSKHPDVIKPFFEAFANFSWVGTADYMRKVKWYWARNNTSPSVLDLHECVFGLLESALVEIEKTGITDSTVESGGFKVRVVRSQNKKTRVTIQFDKSLINA